MLKSLTFGNCSFPGLEAENRLPFCSRKSKPSKRGKEEAALERGHESMRMRPEQVDMPGGRK